MVVQHRQTSGPDILVRAPASAPRAFQLRQSALGFLVVAGLVFVASVLGILTRPQQQLAAFWLTNALLVGMFARRPSLASAAGWCGALLGYIAADLATGSSLALTLRLTASNLAGVAAGVVMIRHMRREVSQRSAALSMPSVLAVAVVASLAASLAGALTSTMALDFATTAAFWFSAEMVSYVTILPVMLFAPDAATVRRRPAGRWRLRTPPSRLVPLATLLSTVVLGVAIGGPGAIAFPVPALLWCALAYPLFATAVLTLLMGLWTMVAIASGVIDLQVPAAGTPQLISLRMGLALMAMAPLIVASVNAARNRLLARLTHAADHDALTGTLNRRAFLLRGQALAEEEWRAGGNVVAMMLDIDHFKTINDRYGHAAGDTVLTAFATRLREHLRDGGLFGRFGGEEFAVLLPGLSTGDARGVAERLCAVARQPIVLDDGRTLAITISVGVAPPAQAARPDTLEQLLRQADAALYQAKAAGRNRVVA